MESSGTPASEQGTPPPPPPPPTGTSTGGKPSGVLRALAVLLALVLLVGVVFVGALAVVGLDSVDCSDPVAVQQALMEDGLDATCYESSALRAVIIGLGFLAAALGLIGVILALAFAITTRFGGLLLRVTIAAVVTGVIAYIVAALD